MPAVESFAFDEMVTAMLGGQKFFRPGSAVWVARAPGRLDVMGGNVDYTGGLVLQRLLREAVWVTAQLRKDSTIRVLNPGCEQFGWRPYLEISTNDLDKLATENEWEPGARWGRYVLGAFCYLGRFYGWTGGMDLFVESDLPPNKGVSSSAALTIAALKAAAACAGITLDGVQLATAGQWIENVVAGAACGIMDQAAIVLGRNGQLLPLLCQPCEPFSNVRLPHGVRLWGIDSMVRRATTSQTYEHARAAAFMAYKLLCQKNGVAVERDISSQIPRWTDANWNGYLSNLSPAEFRARYEAWLPEWMAGEEFLKSAGSHVDPFTETTPGVMYPVRAAARYAVEENARVKTAYALLRSGGDALDLLGEIFCQSHHAYGECGLGANDCDELVEMALRAGFAGAKMTGGGSGGVVAVLGLAEQQKDLLQLATDYGTKRGTMPYIFDGSSDGVDQSHIQMVRI